MHEKPPLSHEPFDGGVGLFPATVAFRARRKLRNDVLYQLGVLHSDRWDHVARDIKCDLHLAAGILAFLGWCGACVCVLYDGGTVGLALRINAKVNRLECEGIHRALYAVL